MANTDVSTRSDASPMLPWAGSPSHVTHLHLNLPVLDSRDPFKCYHRANLLLLFSDGLMMKRHITVVMQPTKGLIRAHVGYCEARTGIIYSASHFSGSH